MDLRYQFDRETEGFAVKLIPEISHTRYLRTNVAYEMARWIGGMDWHG